MVGIGKLLLLLSLYLGLSHAALTLSNTLGSNMVLQRAPLQAKLWGWADDGAIVIVGFNGVNLPATMSAGGSWFVLLPPTDAGGPYAISISSSTGDKLALDNILFGDVYVCSGQSNMQFTVDSAFNNTEEVAAAANYPFIRVFSVGTSHVSNVTLQNLAGIQLPWSVASPASIGGGNWTYMSAVCWFFGRDLYDQYKVPVGLISTNWGGTYIQAWSSPDALQKCNQSTEVKIPNNPNQPSVLYNAMIAPFLPQAIRGVLWYQGEANVGAGVTLYACMEQAMISDWRAKFGSGFSFPFFFVQLAPWIGEQSISVAVADIRDAQLYGLNLNAVGYASAVDLGDPVSPFNPIHPRNKQEVSRRLVTAARNIAYGENVVWQGPTFASATQSVNGNAGTVEVEFATFGVAGLYYKEAVCPPQVPANTCANWEILLSDGVWHPAVTATLSPTPNNVVLTIDLTGGLTIKGVRYAYAIWPLTTLFSQEGLPAIPFAYAFSSEFDEYF